MRRALLGIFYTVAAVIVGALAAAIAANVPFLSWLAFGKSIGLPVDTPMVLDLSVVKVAFGFEVGVTVAHILAFIGAFFGYKYTIKAMHLNGKHEGEE